MRVVVVGGEEGSVELEDAGAVLVDAGLGKGLGRVRIIGRMRVGLVAKGRMEVDVVEEVLDVEKVVPDVVVAVVEVVALSTE